MPSPRALVAAVAWGAAVVATAPAARANGAFPESGLALVDPNDPAHLVVRATYGVLVSRDAGRTWDWVCEAGVGYANYDPMIGLTADGSTLAGLYQGLAASRDGACDFRLVDGGWAGASVVDLAVRRGAPHEVLLVASFTGQPDAGAGAPDRAFRSGDDGRTFTKAGDLPGNFQALTIDVAPSDASRIYVSGLVRAPGQPMAGSLARSVDGGATWTVTPIANLGATTAPYVAAIDPVSADTVYVRSSGVPGRLFVTRDGGASFTQVWAAAGFLKAFALSPDGATVVAGGPAGLFAADTKTLAFAKRSTLGATCLTWAAAGLYACAKEKSAGFELGVSTDGGATFAPVMHLPCVRGPLSCGEATSVGSACGAAWPAVAQQIGQPWCGKDGGAPPNAGGAGGATGGAGGAGGSGEIAPRSSPGAASSGCGCELARRVPGGDPVAVIALAVGSAAAVRRARRGLRVRRPTAILGE